MSGFLSQPDPVAVTVEDEKAKGAVKPFAHCCAEAGGDPESCDCVNKDHGTAVFHATCIITNCRNRAPAGEAFCKWHREFRFIPATPPTPVSETTGGEAVACRSSTQHNEACEKREAVSLSATPDGGEAVAWMYTRGDGMVEYFSDPYPLMVEVGWTETPLYPASGVEGLKREVERLAHDLHVTGAQYRKMIAQADRLAEALRWYADPAIYRPSGWQGDMALPKAGPGPAIAALEETGR